MVKNQIRRISLSSGTLGLLLTNRRHALESAIAEANAEGWHATEIIEQEQRNLFMMLLKLLVFILTLTLWTWGSPYLIVLERSVDVPRPAKPTEPASPDVPTPGSQSGGEYINTSPAPVKRRRRAILVAVSIVFAVPMGAYLALDLINRRYGLVGWLPSYRSLVHSDRDPRADNWNSPSIPAYSPQPLPVPAPPTPSPWELLRASNTSPDAAGEAARTLASQRDPQLALFLRQSFENGYVGKIGRDGRPDSAESRRYAAYASALGTLGDKESVPLFKSALAHSLRYNHQPRVEFCAALAAIENDPEWNRFSPTTPDGESAFASVFNWLRLSVADSSALRSTWSMRKIPQPLRGEFASGFAYIPIDLLDTNANVDHIGNFQLTLIHTQTIPQEDFWYPTITSPTEVHLIGQLVSCNDTKKTAGRCILLLRRSGANPRWPWRIADVELLNIYNQDYLANPVAVATAAPPLVTNTASAGALPNPSTAAGAEVAVEKSPTSERSTTSVERSLPATASPGFVTPKTTSTVAPVSPPAGTSARVAAIPASPEASAAYEQAEKAISTTLQKDWNKAAALYRRASDLGHARASAKLGACYLNGFGLKKDHEQAFNLFRKSAELGDELGEGWLALAYESGMGIRADGAEAMKWYKLAVEHGNREAMHNLGRAYAEGRIVAQDATAAAKWYRSSAEAGFKAGETAWGRCLYEGKGVVRDAAEGLKWLKKARDEGDADAAAYLRRNNLR